MPRLTSNSEPDSGDEDDEDEDEDDDTEEELSDGEAQRRYFEDRQKQADSWAAFSSARQDSSEQRRNTQTRRELPVRHRTRSAHRHRRARSNAPARQSHDSANGQQPAPLSVETINVLTIRKENSLSSRVKPRKL